MIRFLKRLFRRRCRHGDWRTLLEVYPPRLRSTPMMQWTPEGGQQLVEGGVYRVKMRCPQCGDCWLEEATLSDVMVASYREPPIHPS